MNISPTIQIYLLVHVDLSCFIIIYHLTEAIQNFITASLLI